MCTDSWNIRTCEKKRGQKASFLYLRTSPKLGVIETSLTTLFRQMKQDGTNYPKGVMWAFEKRGVKFDTGVDFLIYGNIPNGSGLSSSASLEVLTGLDVKRYVWGRTVFHAGSCTDRTVF